MCFSSHHGGVIFGLGGLDVLGYSQVDEPVLGLGLHHAGPLLTHHLDVFLDVDITVQTCGEPWERHEFHGPLREFACSTFKELKFFTYSVDGFKDHVDHNNGARPTDPSTGQTQNQRKYNVLI